MNPVSQKIFDRLLPILEQRRKDYSFPWITIAESRTAMAAAAAHVKHSGLAYEALDRHFGTQLRIIKVDRPFEWVSKAIELLVVAGGEVTDEVVKAMLNPDIPLENQKGPIMNTLKTLSYAVQYGDRDRQRNKDTRAEAKKEKEDGTALEEPMSGLKVPAAVTKALIYAQELSKLYGQEHSLEVQLAQVKSRIAELREVKAWLDAGSKRIEELEKRDMK